MKITITGYAAITWDDEDEMIRDQRLLMKLDGHQFEEPDFATYLDEELADLGIQGATVKLEFIRNVGLLGHTIFRSPVKLSKAQLAALRSYTAGQWSDGIGESEIEVTLTGKTALIHMALDTEYDAVKQEKDRTTVTGPPQIAICARDGNLEMLEALLIAGGNPAESHQDCPAIYLAVQGGHYDSAQLLLKHGADPNAVVPGFQSTPLHTCATSRNLDDDSGTRLAELLLFHGADPKRRSDTGMTAADYAENRKKWKLYELLKDKSK